VVWCVLAILVTISFRVWLALRQRVRHQKNTPHYRRARFLSAAERSFYGVLHHALSSDYIIFTKVRLADIIQPVSNGRSAWQSSFNRIVGKHVDFVLCHRSRLNVVAAIELDDQSHAKPERAQRDAFVDSALAEARIPVIRFPARHTYSPEAIRSQISAVLSSGTSASRQTNPSNSPHLHQA